MTKCCSSWKFIKDVDKLKFSPKSRQVYLASGPLLLTIGIGMIQGYSAVLLPQLEKQRLIEQNNVRLKSWIASMAVLPMPFACYLGYILMELIGRKYTHMLGSIVCVTGWTIICCFSTTPLVLVGRFITGFCVGLLAIPTCTYITETAESNLGRVLLVAVSFALPFGIALSHLLGTFFFWRTQALVSCFLPLLALIVISFAPESPAYLAKKRQRQAATDAFYWCKGRDEKSENELAELLQKQSAQASEQVDSPSYLSYKFCKPLVLTLVLSFASQWSGNTVISYYSITVFQKMLGGKIDEYLSMLLVDLVRLIGFLIACYLLSRVSHRKLTLISFGGVALSLFSVSIWIYFTTIYPHITVHNYLILIALVLYMIFLTVGLVDIPFTLMEGLFPSNTTVLGSRIMLIMNYCFMFSVVKCTPQLLGKLGAEGLFFVYGTVAFAAFVICCQFYPTVEGKPLDENA